LHAYIAFIRAPLSNCPSLPHAPPAPPSLSGLTWLIQSAAFAKWGRRRFGRELLTPLSCSAMTATACTPRPLAPVA
jgi:hypothetical protein